MKKILYLLFFLTFCSCKSHLIQQQKKDYNKTKEITLVAIEDSSIVFESDVAKLYLSRQDVLKNWDKKEEPILSERTQKLHFQMDSDLMSVFSKDKDAIEYNYILQKKVPKLLELGKVAVFNKSQKQFESKILKNINRDIMGNYQEQFTFVDGIPFIITVFMFGE